MTVSALIVAAGSGLRAGGEVPKQYQKIGGKPVIRFTVEAFLDHPEVDMVQIVIGEGHEALYEEALGDLDLPAPVTGGATRQQSVFEGLRAIATSNPSKVLIHDAARPFISSRLISTVISELENVDGTVPGTPVTDTIKSIDKHMISGTVDRESLRAVQTPQGFRFETIFAAHDKAEKEGAEGLTDDASLFEWAGIPVSIVAGEQTNIKLTTAEDIIMADQKMQKNELADLGDIRTGQGFDVHAFEDGDHVILCGVKIPHTHGLKGHSDADVAMHALTDAILGSLGEGDIGAHFPPSDDQWKLADSAIFLKGASDVVALRGGAIAHCDVTVICEQPKLRPHIDAMKERLAEILAIPASRVSVKATTSEKLGFTGRKEGIAALATATVRLPF